MEKIVNIIEVIAEFFDENRHNIIIVLSIIGAIVGGAIAVYSYATTAESVRLLFIITWGILGILQGAMLGGLIGLGLSYAFIVIVWILIIGGAIALIISVIVILYKTIVWRN